VANDQAYMTITIPIGDPLPAGFSWRQVKLNVYFWRKEDAGYFFQTRLIDSFTIGETFISAYTTATIYSEVRRGDRSELRRVSRRDSIR
jgi:hypothetical protein